MSGRNNNNINMNNIEKRMDELERNQKRILRAIEMSDETNRQLINLLGPLFPQLGADDVYNTNDEIRNATTQALEFAVATPQNPNLHGERTIPLITEEAKRMAGGNKKKINNVIRLKALVKQFMSQEQRVGMQLIENDNGTLKTNYKILKGLALDEKRIIFKDRPELKDCTWKEVDPECRSKAVFRLEAIAYKTKDLPIHQCVDMWAADRLMFEAFRAEKKVVGRKRTADSMSEGDDEANGSSNNGENENDRS